MNCRKYKIWEVVVAEIFSVLFTPRNQPQRQGKQAGLVSWLMWLAVFCCGDTLNFQPRPLAVAFTKRTWLMLKVILIVIATYSMSYFELFVSLCKIIQSLVVRFWWDNSEDKKKMHWISLSISIKLNIFVSIKYLRFHLYLFVHLSQNLHFPKLIFL